MEQVSAKEGLALQEMQRLIDLSESGMLIAFQGPELRFKYANNKFYSMFGYSEKEFEEQFNNCIMEVIIPEEKQKVRNLIARQSAVGGELKLEYRILRKDGVVQWISMVANMVQENDRTWYYCWCTNITQQKKNVEEICRAKQETDLITNSIPGGVVKINTKDFSLIYANDGFFRLAGYSRMEYYSLLGNKCNYVIHPEDAPMVQRIVRSAVENRGVIGIEYRIISKSGEVRWSYVNGCRIDESAGDVVYLCVIVDITARKKLEERLQDHMERSRHLLKHMKETEWTYDVKSGKINGNGHFEILSEHMNTIDIEYIEQLIHPSDKEPFHNEVMKRIENLGTSRVIYRVRNSIGEYVPAEFNMISVSVSDGKTPDKIYGETRIIDTRFYDSITGKERVTKDTKTSEAMLVMAETAQSEHEDSVTGMMSYKEFIEKTNQILKNRNEAEHYGILCSDVNEFRKLNYHYGLSVGNEILQSFGNALRKDLAYNDLCCRIKGDYFVVLLKYGKHSELLKIMSRMVHMLTEKEENHTYSTYGMTSGIYLVSTEEEELDTMLGKADIARRSIKGTRGNHFAIYTDDLQETKFKEAEIIRDIDEAINHHEVEVCYQPRVHNEKENVVGCKAVPRIQLRTGEYLPIEDLRRYIDRSKEVQSLVFYVLSSVCSSLGAWKSKGKKVMTISMDITPSQLCLQNAVEQIDTIRKSNNVDVSEIVFEIQEHYFNDMTTSFEMALKELNKRGYRVIISRFGSDHTAVHSIRQFPISGIKFHGEFFHQNIKNEKDKLILKKIVDMAKELGMTVSCGGIYTQYQDEMAKDIGCDYYEGDIYYGVVRCDVYEKCFLEK